MSWLTRSPLVLPEGIGWLEKGEVRIPGSSAKGAVRSVHEALFAGCPRVVTSDFVPVYREPVTAGMVDDWDLAMVTELSDNGDPRSVRLCKDPVWVNAVALKKRYGSELPRTGDVINFDQTPWDHRGLDRDELPPRKQTALTGRAFRVTRREAVKPAGKGWTRGRVLLVTDTAARPMIKKQHNRNHDPIPSGIPGQHLRETAACFWATGDLTGELAYFSEPADPTFPADGLSSFRRLVDGTRDVQVDRQRRLAPSAAAGTPGQPDVFADVAWWKYDAGRALRLPGQPRSSHADPALVSTGAAFEPDPADLEPVARRRRADGRLLVGDVVWVKCSRPAEGRAKVVTAVKLAAAWRTTPEDAGDLGGRLTATACATSEHLCLSCAIFGSVDEAGAAAGTGQQTAYGGHVRFGSVVGTGLRVGGPVRLAPLSSPRPGAGMFYLEDRDLPLDRKLGDLPGQWGSAVDRGRPRQMRGRKFYWHSDPEAQVRAVREAGVREPEPRHRQAGADGFSSTARLVDAGQRLTQMVSFDGLDRIALLTLVAAFDPSKILPASPGDYGLHLGGGKPFGLGSVTASVDSASMRVTTTAGRYVGEAVAPFDPTWTDADRAALTARVGDLSTVQEAAAQVLAVHGLGEFEPLVTYPITVSWRRYGSVDFVRSFAFFGRNSGEKLTGRSREYAPLPDLQPVDEQSPAPEPGLPDE